MEIVIAPAKEDLAAVAADSLARQVRVNPQFVLGLATGSTPLPLYRALKRHADAGVDFSQVRGFALDEYVGIPEEHPESYASVIRTQVVEPLGMNPDLVHVPPARASDLAAAAEDYERRIREAGGVDVQILGIGANGHIGFNEPTSSFASRTRIKTLAPQTRADNARFFDSIDEVPTHCMTQGLGTILDAKKVFLFAFGENKADAVAGAVEGPVTAMCPGSVLQFHQHAVFFVDEAAASKLANTEYYRYVFEHKPTWQVL